MEAVEDRTLQMEHIKEIRSTRSTSSLSTVTIDTSNSLISTIREECDNIGTTGILSTLTVSIKEFSLKFWFKLV